MLPLAVRRISRRAVDDCVPLHLLVALLVFGNAGVAAQLASLAFLGRRGRNVAFLVLGDT